MECLSFNHVSPCLCQLLQNAPACGREIEGFPEDRGAFQPILTWTSAESFRIRKPVPEGQHSTLDVTVALEPDGWMLEDRVPSQFIVIVTPDEP